MTQTQELSEQARDRRVLAHHEHLLSTARTGPHDELSVTEILNLDPELLGPAGCDPCGRKRGVADILKWLAGFPGAGWQERWLSSGADTGVDWMDELAASDPRSDHTARSAIRNGMIYLLACQVVLPGYGYLNACKSYLAMQTVQLRVTPELFAQAEQTADELGIKGQQKRIALNVLAKIVMHTGKGLGDVTEADLFEYRASTTQPTAVQAAWQILTEMGVLTGDTTMRAALQMGQMTVAQIVDSYGIQDKAVRDVLVRYLEERKPSLDFNTLRTLASQLCGNFWRDIEMHHPGISSLHLPPEVASAWKDRVAEVELPDGSRRPRKSRLEVLMLVRAFYLDIQEWALEDASWAQWAVPSPVRRGETEGMAKAKKKAQAEMHQRIRERLPQLPALVEAAEAHRHDRAALLEKAAAASVGEAFDHGGRAYVRLGQRQVFGEERASQNVVRFSDLGADPAEITDITREEDEAFWAWAIIETFRYTGVRIEELLEITHLALVTHRLADTGEVVPLLQIVPSKTNEERLLLIVPELASVLATIIARIRGDDGLVPMVARYDPHERIFGPRLPHLFQRQHGWRRRVISRGTVVRLLDNTLARTGLTDHAGNPLRFTPHDFRRIFTTEAVTGGLPVHIAARILGHNSLDTTQGYMAVFQDDLIRAYRTFVNSRRAERPAAEYREPTDEEWREFQQHFELRKVELGNCGRPYGTPCNHEHACVRCPMLQIDPRQKGRLGEIISNLKDRIAEAKANGWGGEVQGLQVSLDAAQAKMANLIRAEQKRQAGGPTLLGMPMLGTKS